MFQGAERLSGALRGEYVCPKGKNLEVEEGEQRWRRREGERKGGREREPEM